MLAIIKASLLGALTVNILACPYLRNNLKDKVTDSSLPCFSENEGKIIFRAALDIHSLRFFF